MPPGGLSRAEWVKQRHYLTKLQEKFMPYGLHIFGRDWSQASLDLMLDSMKKVFGKDPAIRKKGGDE